MKKLLSLILLAAPLAFILSGCGNGGANENPYEGMKEINLIILDDSLSIMVPDSLKGNIEIMEQSWGATEVKIGERFQISIEQKEGDTELQKSDIAGNDVYEFQRYLTEEANLLLWESKIPAMEKNYFHFYLIHDIGGTPYEIKDIDNGEFPYSEGDINAMLNAGKSLKLKKSTEEEDHHS